MGGMVGDSLRENNLVNWHELVTKVAGVQLVDQPDKFICSLKKKWNLLCTINV